MSSSNLAARAAALVSSGAAVNLDGATAVLNATIDLIVSQHCEFHVSPGHEDLPAAHK